MSLTRHNKPIAYTKDGAIMTTLRQPQIMLARFTGFTEFFKNRRRNEQLRDEWNRRNPRPGRPI